MSLLFKHLRIEGDLGSDELEALFDTGATYRKSVAQRVATILPLPRPKSFELAERGRVLEAKERITIDIIVNGVTISDEVVVIEDLSEELILGASTMQKWRIKLDLEKEDVIIDPRAVRLKKRLRINPQAESRSGPRPAYDVSAPSAHLSPQPWDRLPGAGKEGMGVGRLSNPRLICQPGLSTGRV